MGGGPVSFEIKKTTLKPVEQYGHRCCGVPILVPHLSTTPIRSPRLEAVSIVSIHPVDIE
jgi:hypothetical protein